MPINADVTGRHGDRAEPRATSGHRAREITTWSATGQRSRQPVNTLDAEAIAAVREMKRLIEEKGLPPWARDVEKVRKDAQKAYSEMMLGEADRPASQSIDDMWLKTTHFWINTYRVAARRADAQIATLPSSTKDDHPFKAERNKIHTHFRQALKNEEVVYRTLIVDLVKRWHLESLVQKHLKTIGIKVKPSESGHSSIGLLEKKEKLRLVSYALCSLGDMQRYRTQLRVQMDQASGRSVSMSADSSEHAKAREYYDCARYIDFENGSAYHQRAVLCSLLKDDFGTTYYLIRAAACKQPWGKIGDELSSRMQKALEVWKQGEASVAAGDEIDASPEIQLKTNFMAIMAMLYLCKESPQFTSLDDRCRHDLANALSDRLLGAETIARLTTSLIGVHWHVRNNLAIIAGGTRGAQNRINFEHAALSTVLLEFAVILQVATQELQGALRDRPTYLDSAVMDDDQQLGQMISGVLRRLLPSIRIISKWLKLNFDYIRRLLDKSSTLWQSFTAFWHNYSTFIGTLIELFPINQLPSITGPLEEDLDLRGFSPISRGLTTHGGRVSEENEGEIESDGPIHPDEVQLMRLSDIQVEARLLMRHAADMGLDSPFDVSRLEVRVEQEDDALGEPVQEDDPVRMAFRAAVDDGGSIGFGPDGASQAGGSTDAEDEEEEIVFKPKQISVPAPPTNLPTPPPDAGRSIYDMLQQVTQGIQQPMLSERAPQPPQPPRSKPEHNRAPGSSSPQGLFGVGGNSMWSMSREESQKGINRTTSHPGQLRPDPRSHGHDQGPSLVFPAINGTEHHRRQSAERALGAANAWRDPSVATPPYHPTPPQAYTDVAGFARAPPSVPAFANSPWSQSGGGGLGNGRMT